jgi:hypothetical protein
MELVVTYKLFQTATGIEFLRAINKVFDNPKPELESVASGGFSSGEGAYTHGNSDSIHPDADKIVNVSLIEP